MRRSTRTSRRREVDEDVEEEEVDEDVEEEEVDEDVEEEEQVDEGV